ncbi:MAG: hypothetical protein GXP49_14200 [Deltaproteobacteria bacterium]|nr:hypothetical protein [Deltaproteobacteria bacterium]
MRSSWGIGLLLTLSNMACIPESPIEGAPCGCPGGYECCETLGTCVRAGSDCPDTYPASSARACKQDQDCPQNELCLGWLVDKDMAGPMECRHECEGDYPCAPGEICELALHDVRDLFDMNTARLCMPKSPPAGCEGYACQNCPADRLGMTFCSGKYVHACMIGLHPLCGLTCKLVSLQDCDQDGECEDVQGGARCIGFGKNDWCKEYDCGNCGTSPGSFSCDGQDVAACESVGITDDMCPAGRCDCKEICIRTVISTCTGKCDLEGGAHCEP